jgi:hypothetical protein
MDWQLWAAFGLVAAAVLYLLRALWRSWSGTKGSCGGGCDCGTKPGTQKDRPTMIPVEQLTLRRRETDIH